jgi:hypothetical protein
MSFDEAYANMVHDEFRAAPGNGVVGVAEHTAPSSAQGSRTRTIALVASGGIACAVVGALLGGLGGEFGISPASAHALNASSETVPLSSVADAAFHSHAAAAAPALANGVSIGTLTNTVTGGGTHGTSVATTIASAVGGLLGGSSPFIPPSVNTLTPLTGDPVTSSSGGSTAPTGAVNDVEFGLTAVLGNLTKALQAITTLPSDPSGSIDAVVLNLSDTLGDVTSTLTHLSTDLPSTLPSTLGTLPVLSTLAPVLSAGTDKTSSSGGSTVPSSLKALAPVVAAVNGLIPSTGSSSPGLPALPTIPLPGLSSVTTPSLPTSSTLSLPDLPSLNLPTLPTSSTGTGGGVTIPVPLPLPSGVNLGVNPTIGPISVGVSVSSAGITVSTG